jgi:hypothetical protein
MLDLIRSSSRRDGFAVRDFIRDNAINFIRVEHRTPIMDELSKNSHLIDVFGDLRSAMRLGYGAPDYTFTSDHRFSFWGFYYLGHRVFVCCSVRGTTFEMLSYDFEKSPASVIGEFIKEFYREVVNP